MGIKLTKQDYMRLSKERLAELLELRDKADEVSRELVGRITPPSIVVAPYNPPCYAPDGICTNPQHDCINCPTQSTGVSTTTGTSATLKDNTSVTDGKPHNPSFLE